MRRISGVMAILVLGGLVGCASTPPPKELVSARQSYERARMAGAQALVPADLHDARKALERAEQAYAYDDEAPEAKDWGYIADREARKVEALAGIAAAQRQRTAAVAAYRQAQAEIQRRTSAELSSRTAQLSQTQQQFLAQQAELERQRQQVGEERQARLAAEGRAQAAMESLANIAQVKEEARGLVITVSGSVLFASGKAELLPIARDKLSQVADVLKSEPGQRIVVEGYTDAVGTEESNLTLSQQRAEAVRTYLVSRGVPTDAISAEGKGESSPIADNNTAEGRANNRRVEIVVKPARAEGQPSLQTSPARTEPPAQRGQPQIAPGVRTRPEDLMDSPYDD